MVLEAGYQCPMGGYGMYGSNGGFPLAWVLSLIIVAACTGLITYFIIKNSSGKTTGQGSGTGHNHKKKRRG